MHARIPVHPEGRALQYYHHHRRRRRELVYIILCDREQYLYNTVLPIMISSRNRSLVSTLVSVLHSTAAVTVLCVFCFNEFFLNLPFFC